MPTYSYKARDSFDRMITGTINGTTIDEALERLTEKKLTPVLVDELNFDGTPKNVTLSDRINEWLLTFQNKVHFRDVVFFTRQIATMIEGGVPLTRALEQLARSEKVVFKRILEQIAMDIEIGHTLSDALAKHPGAFDNMYVAVVRSGEATGHLDTVLDQMATYMENTEAMKSKIKAALRYPAAISLIAVVMVIGLLVFLVPTFQNLYASYGGTLPKPTQILVAVSDLIRQRFPIVIGLLIAGAVGLKLALTNRKIRLFFDQHFFKFPVFGGILRKNIFATFCRTMALLMESGTPILEALQIAGAAVNNSYYASSLEKVYANLRQGELLSTALENEGHFPTLVTQLVATGEESGKIDALLRKAAVFYEREIRNVVDSLASIIEPFLIIFLGGILGSILIALYYPIFMIGKLVGR